MSLLRKAFNKLFGILEETMCKNWLNPFATIYFCFRSLPFKKALILPVWCYGRPRFFSLKGKIEIHAPVKPGMIRINFTNPGSPHNAKVGTEINNNGRIIFEGSAKIRTGNRIVVDHNATLCLGERVIIADKIIIGCFESITIGADTRITHCSQIFDSSYHYIADLRKGFCMPIKGSVNIGCGCWIANSVQIHKGTVLPDYSIVASGSIVNKDFGSYRPGTFFAGIPAKPHDTDLRTVQNFEKAMEIESFYFQHPDSIFKLPEDVDSGWFKQ